MFRGNRPGGKLYSRRRSGKLFNGFPVGRHFQISDTCYSDHKCNLPLKEGGKREQNDIANCGILQ